MASPFSLPTALHPPLSDREAVTDTMHRCAMAWDTDDAALFDTTFLPDAVLDINGRAMTGLPEIHATGLALIFGVDTTHLVTNLRVHVNPEENKASLTAMVLSQHYAKNKGLEMGQKSLMAGSLYRGDLVKDEDGLWKFKHLLAKSIWMEGDFSVIGGDFNEKEQK